MENTKMVDDTGAKWKYILIVGAGSYFAHSLWGLFSEVMTHRFKHWIKGEGWYD